MLKCEKSNPNGYAISPKLTIRLVKLKGQYVRVQCQLELLTAKEFKTKREEEEKKNRKEKNEFGLSKKN